MAKQPRQFPTPKKVGKVPHELELTVADIIAAVNSHYEELGLSITFIPDDAEAWYEVPTGGDYSGVSLCHTTDDKILKFTWKE